MLNIFKLQEAVNESVTGNVASLASIKAYDFIGTMDEATAEFNYELMAEAVEFHEFVAGAEEIMTEAALNNPDRLDTIQESVFENIKTGLTKFFEKIKAMIKGIIEKLKGFFYKLTGKTDKWVSIMKPRIEKAKQATGAADISYEMHNWNKEFILTGMKEAIEKLDAKALSGSDTAKNRLSSNIAEYANRAKAEKGSNPDADKFKAEVEKLDRETQKTNDEIEAFKDTFAEDVAEVFGVKNNSSLDAVWTDIAHKATGGEKTEVKFRGMVDDMLKSIEGSKKTVDNLKKFYDKHLKEINDMQTKCNTVIEKFDIKGEDKLPIEIVRAARAAVQAYSKKITNEMSAYESACNTARGQNVKYVQDMTSEYMNALTKFAGVKSSNK